MEKSEAWLGRRPGPVEVNFWELLKQDILQATAIPFTQSVYVPLLFIKKLQAIYLMLYKRWYKTAKIKKYKHEHVLAYTFNLSSVARIK